MIRGFFFSNSKTNQDFSVGYIQAVFIFWFLMFYPSSYLANMFNEAVENNKLILLSVGSPMVFVLNVITSICIFDWCKFLERIYKGFCNFLFFVRTIYFGNYEVFSGFLVGDSLSFLVAV